MAAERTTGIFSPTLEQDLAWVELYRKMEFEAPENAKPFFTDLSEEAKIDIERESLEVDV
jgi:hypothetical protein